MASTPHESCPDCDGVSRRDFLTVAGSAAFAGVFAGVVRGAEAQPRVAETSVTELYKTLTDDQKKVLCFPFEHPLRQKVQANWNITEPSIGEMSEPQQALVDEIVRGLTSADGYEKFMQQMADDHDGLPSYHFAIFGKPGEEKFEFVLTGRHVTMRADGNAVAGVAFGGPMVYGHAASDFNEDANHTGNVFWYQAKRANEVFGALDPAQRKIALVGKAPAESDITHRSSGYPGIAVGELSSDQKDLVNKVMHDLLSPYRKQDVDEVMQILTANGGLEKIHLAYYNQTKDGKNADVGDDGVWDIWRLEGPGFVWHFRGFPHVHTWVNIARV